LQALFVHAGFLDRRSGRIRVAPIRNSGFEFISDFEIRASIFSLYQWQNVFDLAYY
jgi:hypothetical protein